MNRHSRRFSCEKGTTEQGLVIYRLAVGVRDEDGRLRKYGLMRIFSPQQPRAEIARSMRDAKATILEQTRGKWRVRLT